MRRLVKHQRRRFVAQGLQLGFSLLRLGRQKSFEQKTIRRQAAGAERGGQRRCAGQRNDLNPGLNRVDDNAIARIGDRRRARVGHQREVRAALEPLDQQSVLCRVRYGRDSWSAPS